MAKATNFKFGRCAPRDSPNTNSGKIYEKGAWLGSHDPINFTALNANSFKIARYKLQTNLAHRITGIVPI